MASTNKTTNYELSQYIGTDKPTYLTDYNQDMSKIDAGIHAAKSEADTNASSIGTLSSLTTTAKTSCVAAINEVDADVATNTNNIATNTSNIATNTTHIGTVANLTTTSKTDLVVAANEINAKVGNVSNLETDNKTSTVAAINEIAEFLNLNVFEEATNFTCSASGYTMPTQRIHIAKNADGSLAKIYGEVWFSYNTPNYGATASFQTSLRPSSAITVDGGCNGSIMSSSAVQSESVRTFTIGTDGVVTFNVPAQDGQSRSTRMYFINSLLFIKDFGDVPVPDNQ